MAFRAFCFENESYTKNHSRKETKQQTIRLGFYQPENEFKYGVDHHSSLNFHTAKIIQKS